MAGDITKFSSLKTFRKGDVILKEGAGSTRDMIILLQGNIGVYRDYALTNEAQLKVLGKGSFHGEMALFLNRDQTETLVALSDVVAIVVTQKNSAELFSSQTDMTFTIIQELCRRLDEAEGELSRLRGAGAKQTASRKSALFPEGHGSYLLPLKNDNNEMLYTTKTTCPMCGYAFDNLAFIATRLRLEKTDPDLRARYKDFEPLYYEIITCPNCFFSAPSDSFEATSKRFTDAVSQKIGPYRLEMYISPGLSRDTFTVFAGYYLALLCAPVIFDNHQLTTANLWLKLSRLYQDAGDEKLYLYASQKSLDDYRFAYENLNISEKSSQQLCYLMGDLYLRLGEVDIGRNFFFLAKTNKAGSSVMARQADTRLEEIRELKQKGLL